MYKIKTGKARWGLLAAAALAACWAGPSRACETAQAVQQLRKLVKADPSNAELHYKLAMALSDEGRLDLQRFGKRMAEPVFDEAIAEYGKTIELQPSNTEARKSLASELEFKGKFSEARAQLREIVKLNSCGASPHLELARADLHQDGGDLNEALKLRPNDDTAHFSLGEALRRAGKLDEATEQYREAVRLKAVWKDMLTTNLSTDLAAKDLTLARSDVQVLEKLGYPVDPQLLDQLKAQDSNSK